MSNSETLWTVTCRPYLASNSVHSTLRSSWVEIKKRYSSVTTNSSKYKYQMRFDAYDNHFKELHIKSKEKEVIEWESEQLKFAKQRCNYHNDTLQKLHTPLLLISNLIAFSITISHFKWSAEF